MQPKKPSRPGPFVVDLLRAVSESGHAACISLGGAFGLLHYHDYRETHDIDAWWADDAAAEDMQGLLRTVEEALSAFGSTRRRAWGDVVSVDLQQQGKTVFNFQVARRSARLAPAVPSPWGIPLDDLSDIVASKMVALVERGAPRDFRDIHAVCAGGLLTAGACWDLWRRRVEASGIAPDTARARLAVETHLSRIEQQRPLDGIADPERRAAAEALRTWFRKEFLSALPD